MKAELILHPAQVGVLLTLLFKKKAKFSELNATNLSNDHFTFHIKSLLNGELIKKDGGYYELTADGKEFANRFDTEKKNLERQAKVGILVCCVKRFGVSTKYLVQQRLKEPYFGFYGFVTGKIRWGETLEETAERELLEETGLNGDLKLAGIEHKMDYDKGEKILEDKFFFIFRGESLSGKLIQKYNGGRNLWLTEKEILILPDLFDDVREILDTIGRNNICFKELKYKVKRY